MSRTNVFIDGGNDVGTRFTCGGRRGSPTTGWARINTDNAWQSNCSVFVKAEVVGLGTVAKERRRKDGDQRRSIFTVELPEPSEGCEVYIRESGAALADLARFGAALVALKGVNEAAAGDTPKAIKTIAQAAKFLAEIDSEASKLPHVVLPGGVSLAKALACVKIVEDLVQGKRKNN